MRPLKSARITLAIATSTSQRSTALTSSLVSFTTSTLCKSRTIPTIRRTHEFFEMFGPRDVLETTATDVEDPTVHPRWGKVGKQKIASAGPLPPHPNMDSKAKFNMENVDEELVRRSVDFMERSVKAGKPFFLWHNTTRVHVWTHLAPKWQGKSGFGLFADAMMELDSLVGELLKKLDDLGVADNTIVLFTSDNGAEIASWPDGGNTPFRGEKGTTYEGGFRVPMLLRWPGTVKSGTIINEIMASEDWMPTLLAAAGDPDAKEKLLAGLKAGGKTFRDYLDGYNFLPFFRGEVAESPRREFFYFTDNGDLTAVRYDHGKSVSRLLRATCLRARRSRPTFRW